MMLAQPISGPVPVTVIMLTLNEEFNLPGAIESVKDWAEEVFVVDSCSVDKTVDVALGHGVNIVQRPFTDYGDQWNWALKRLPIKTPWVMKLDADERVSPKLKQEIAAAIAVDPREHAFRVPVRLWFMGKPIHARICVVRLWRRGKARFSNVIVNEHILVDGATARLRNYIEHHDSPDLHHWWDKQNRYTTMRAIEIVKGQKLSAEPKLFGTALERHMFFIKVFFRILFRYQLQWIHELFIRGTWRDGWIGLTWTRLRINVRRLCELKVREMRITGRMLEIPKASRGDFDPCVLASPLQKLVMKDGN